jgi:hypothetical protein
MCTVTAIDPRGRFESQTIEFPGSSTSIKVALSVSTIIDTVADPLATSANFVIHDAAGQILADHLILFRPPIVSFADNWGIRLRTDSRGRVTAQLRKGIYVVAAIVDESSIESKIEITERGKNCADKSATCVVKGSEPSRAGASTDLALHPVTSNRQLGQ